MRSWKPALPVFLICLTSIPPTLAQQPNESAPTAGAIQLSDCHIRNYRQEVKCGTLRVFENRAGRQGREIDIHVAVVPSVDESSELEPVVFFAGGPGQSAIESAAFLRGVLSEVMEERDLVLIDQRGMGSSHPLKCEFPRDEGLDLPPKERDRLGQERLKGCLDGLDADVTQYTQDIANQDIHDVLIALGYDQVNLYGVSWGTRSALLYAHTYPEHVRTVILDGSAPPDIQVPLHAAEDAERAIRLMFDDCAADHHCAKTFPNLEAELAQVMAELGEEGRLLSVDDPLTGEPTEIMVNRNDFGDLVRTALYSSEMSRLVPLIIHRAAAGDYRPMLGLSSAVGTNFADSMTIGATLSILCSEEFGRMDADALAQEAAGDRLLGRGMMLNFSSSCDVWPKAPLPDIYNQTLAPEAPTLILSGQLDPVTPPRWGERTDQMLPNSLHLVASATGHNVGPVGCGGRIMQQFIQQGSFQDLETECLGDLSRPSFFVDPSGPAPTDSEAASND